MQYPKQWPFRKPLEFLHKVKYGGAVGKKTVITVVSLIVVGIAILALWGNVWAILALAALVVVIFFGSLNSIDTTLKAHPELALMDGTEILALRKAEMSAKNGVIVDVTPAIADPSPPPAAIEGTIEPPEPPEGEGE